MSLLKNKRFLIIVGIIIVAIILYSRWNKFKAKWIAEQQKLNEEKIAKGETPATVTSPTIYQFISGGSSTAGSSDSSYTNSETATKQSLIDAMEQKFGYSFTYSQRQSLMTMPIEQLEALLEMSIEEIQGILGV